MTVAFEVANGAEESVSVDVGSGSHVDVVVHGLGCRCRSGIGPCHHDGRAGGRYGRHADGMSRDGEAQVSVAHDMTW